MMAERLPACSGRKAVRVHEKAGFEPIRINGSHHIMRHDRPPVRIVTVPVHGARALKRGSLGAIILQAGLTMDAFAALL